MKRDRGMAWGTTKLFAGKFPTRLLAALVLVAQIAIAQNNDLAQLHLNVSFEPDTIGPGSTSTLLFEISNSFEFPVTSMGINNMLPVGVAVAGFPNIRSNCEFDVSAPAGGGIITFIDGLMAASSTCFASVDVTSASPGQHLFISGSLTSSAGVFMNAGAELTVATDRPGFSKGFSPSSVPFGARTVLTFTIDNSANGSAVLLANFSDQLPRGLRVASPANVTTTCVNSTIVADPGSDFISFSSSFSPPIAAGSTCSISVDISVRAVGKLGNRSGPLITIFPTLVNNGSASAVLEVTGGLIQLVKSFLNDPVLPGSVATLRFVILNRSRSTAATSISFEDDLNATLSGLHALGLPLNNVCGAGSSLSGASTLSFTGGTLEPARFCIFSVGLDVPADAATGAYPNVSSPIIGNLGVDTFVGNTASDVLFVQPVPTFSKNFIEDTAGSGSNTSLKFTIINNSAAHPATDMEFQDLIDSRLEAIQLPPEGFCGAGSTLSITHIIDIPHIDVTGANLEAGGSCIFLVDFAVSTIAPNGVVENATTPIKATIDGLRIIGPSATDSIAIIGAPRLSKRFINNPVSSPGTAMLEFTISNDSNGHLDSDGYENYSNIAFTDDLDAALTGLEAVGLPQNDICGAGSSLSGGSILSLSNGSLSGGTRCTFQVEVSVPAGANPGFHASTSGELTASSGDINVIGNTATADLVVAGLVLTKSFTDDPVLPGGLVTLEFTIKNNSPDVDASDIFFSDDLAAVLAGLTTTDLPKNDICGPGSTLVSLGNTEIFLIGAILADGETCTFSVILDVPVSAEPDAYRNVTSALDATMNAAPVQFESALDDLIVVSPEAATVTVNKAYLVPHSQGLDPEVLITLDCPGAVIDQNGGVDVMTVDRVATFTVSGIPREGMVCSATETVPVGYTLDSSNCFAIAVAPGDQPGPVCTIVNRRVERVFCSSFESGETEPCD